MVSMQSDEETREVQMSVQPSGVEILRRAVRRGDHNDASLPEPLEKRRQQAAILDRGDRQLVETQHRRSLGDLIRKRKEGLLSARQIGELAQMEGLVDTREELVEMRALSPDPVGCRARVKDVHEHGLPGPDLDNLRRCVTYSHI